MMKVFKNLTLVDISIIAVCAAIILGIFIFIDLYRYEYKNWPNGQAMYPAIIQFDKLTKTQCIATMAEKNKGSPYDGLNKLETIPGAVLVRLCFQE